MTLMNFLRNIIMRGGEKNFLKMVYTMINQVSSGSYSLAGSSSIIAKPRQVTKGEYRQ